MTASARSSIGGSAKCRSSSMTTTRSLGGEHLQEAPHRPRGVGSHRRADPEQLREPVADGRAVRLRGHARAQRCRNLLGVPRRSARCLCEQFHEWRERHALAVGGSLSDEHRRPFRGLGRERRGQPRLAHPGRRQDRDEHARLGVDCVASASWSCRMGRSRPTNGVALRLATGSIATTARPAPAPPCPSLRGLDRLGDDRAAHESPGRLPDQHAAGLGGRLQPRGGVHGVADDRRVLARQHHLARRDADARREADRQRLVQRLQGARASRLAARTARRPSSSWASGTPKMATTASPMNFCTRPPWRSTAERISAK